MNNFLNKQVDYFWEYEFPFGEYFLKEIFEGYQRKFSLTGNGLYHLIHIDNKLYEVNIKCARSMVENDGKKAARDDTKNIVVDTIVNALKDNGIEAHTKDGKIITFPLGKFIARCEVIKKLKMPS